MSSDCRYGRDIADNMAQRDQYFDDLQSNGFITGPSPSFGYCQLRMERPIALAQPAVPA